MAKPEISTQDPSEQVAGRTRSVLVVDDSRLMRKILSSSLKKWGYDVTAVESAEAAMEHCRTRLPEIVLSDWMMPGMSGPEFCRAFRQVATTAYSYFILLTSKSDKAEIALGLEAGADDFLTKPVDSHELRARIRAGERILDMQADLRQKNRELGDALREVERLNDALDNDLREARHLQQSLLPERHHVGDGYEIALMLQSSGYVGGDLVGFYPAGQEHIGMYAIDVSGHGISAALMTARLAGYLSGVAPDQNIALRKNESGAYTPVPPAAAIEHLNSLVLGEMETEHYFTMLLGHLNLRSGLLTLGQAGHPHPVVQRANGEMVQDSPGGFPVGLMYGASFSQFEVQLMPGDRVLFHSDGFTECPGPNGAMLGETGLEDMLEKIGDLRGKSFMEALLWHLTDFAGGGKFPDDVSAVLVHYTGR